MGTILGTILACFGRARSSSAFAACPLCNQRRAVAAECFLIRHIGSQPSSSCGLPIATLQRIANCAVLFSGSVGRATAWPLPYQGARAARGDGEVVRVLNPTRG